MRSYQTILILKPDFDETQVDEHLKAIEDLIKTQGGEFLKVDKWGKKRLAYRVKKNRFGFYLNIYHTCDNDKVTALEEKFRLFDPIIKYMVVRLDEKDKERVLKVEEEAAEASEENKKEEAPAAKPADA